MRRLLTLLALAAWVGGAAQAESLLTNGSLDDPAEHEGITATGWALETFNTLSGPALTANFPTFANHTAPPTVDPGRGLWLRAFVGDADSGDLAQANLTQSVPGTPGVEYTLSVWSLFEEFWPGGLPGDVTAVILAIDFLDGVGGPLGTSSLDMELAGQLNDAIWRQFSVTGIAPPGTVSVQARGSLVDGHLVANNPQSGFLDDFELTAVPEPASVVLASLGGLVLLGWGGRCRGRRG